jgi:hypothetical protein
MMVLRSYNSFYLISWRKDRPHNRFNHSFKTHLFFPFIAHDFLIGLGVEINKAAKFFCQIITVLSLELPDGKEGLSITTQNSPEVRRIIQIRGFLPSERTFIRLLDIIWVKK